MFIRFKLTGYQNIKYSTIINFDFVKYIYITKKSLPDNESSIYCILGKSEQGTVFEIDSDSLDDINTYYSAFSNALAGLESRYDNGDYIIPLIPK